MRRSIILNRKGFTLIEIMVVTAIIAILAGISIPNFVRAQQAAVASSCRANMRAINSAIWMYDLTNGAPPGAATQALLGDYMNTVPTNCPDPSAPAYVYVTGESDYVVCPIHGNMTDQVPAGGCFIVTASFGTPCAEEVLILSGFRDQYLINNAYGKMFVLFYEGYSPFISEYTKDKEFLKRLVRSMLKPLAYVCKFFVHKNL